MPSNPWDPMGAALAASQRLDAPAAPGPWDPYGVAYRASQSIPAPGPGSVAQPGPMVMDPATLDRVVRTVYGENTNNQGGAQAGVANAILNRVAQGGPGSSGGVVGVTAAPNQFSTWNPLNQGGNMQGRNLVSGSPAYNSVAQIVQDVYSGLRPDPTGGAQNYFNPTQVNPSWAAPLASQGSVMVGPHMFVGQGPTRISPAAVAGSMYDQGMSSS